MKKLFSSAFLIVVFVSYALSKRTIGSNTDPVPLPTTQPRSLAYNGAIQGKYRDGTYIGPSVNAYYGNVQIQVAVQNGQITDVQFLDHPQNSGHSVQINTYAMPRLKSEAIQAQSAPVDIVSGATATSKAFNQSLTSVLAQAGV